jgi:hypothetical protein
VASSPKAVPEGSSPQYNAPTARPPSFVSALHPERPSLLLVVMALGGFVLFAAAGVSCLSALQLQAAPNRVMALASEKTLGVRHAGTATFDKLPMLSLFVKDQPAAKDRQNLHLLKPGYSLSLGGDETDDLLVSIVTIPPRIGRVRFDGKRYTFVPRKKQLLPDTGSATIQDCIGKQIRIAHKDYDIRLEIARQENPLCTLGPFLQSVRG